MAGSEALYGSTDIFTYNKEVRIKMSLEFEFCSVCTRHIGMSFSRAPKCRSNLARKLLACNSDLISIPFKTTLMGHSEGREKMWNYFKRSEGVLSIMESESCVWRNVLPSEDIFSTIEEGVMLGSL